MVGEGTQDDEPTVIVTIQHPAHVHFFRQAIDVLETAGVDVHVFVRGPEMVRHLLDAYDIAHRFLAGDADSIVELARTQAAYEFRLWRAARRLDPDVITAIGGVAAAHVAPLVGARSLVFTDTEHATLQNRITFPVAHRICTPACYRDDVGTRQVRYPGYHELAYLHPDRFSPSADAFEGTDLDPSERYVLLRTVDWNAAHDVGKRGLVKLRTVIERLESTGARVVVSAQSPLESDLERYRVPVAPERMHDLLAYADLVLGESATMTTEAAVLGTPAVYVSNWETGYTGELERQYGLLFNFVNEDRKARQRRALSKAETLLTGEDHDWQERRRHLLDERVDTTNVIVGQVREMASISGQRDRSSEVRESPVRENGVDRTETDVGGGA